MVLIDLLALQAFAAICADELCPSTMRKLRSAWMQPLWLD
jgi:hypothetical protein